VCGLAQPLEAWELCDTAGRHEPQPGKLLVLEGRLRAGGSAMTGPWLDQLERQPRWDLPPLSEQPRLEPLHSIVR